jgi:hypothetical protein
MHKNINKFGSFVKLEIEPFVEQTHPGSPQTLSESSNSTMGDHENSPPSRTLQDYLHPTRTTTPSCIMFPPNTSNEDFKPEMIPLLPTFHGLENDNLYVHIRKFEAVVATFHGQVGAIDTLRLKFFPLSLKDRAKSWLYSLKPGSIGS